MTKTGCVESFLTSNPSASTTEIIEHVKNTVGSPVDAGSISKVRKRMGLRKRIGKKRRSGKNIPALLTISKESTISAVVKEGLRRNPEASNEELRLFVSEVKGVEIKNPLNGTLVKKLRDGMQQSLSKTNPCSETRAPRTNRKIRIYTNMWTHPVEGLSKQSRELLSSFIEELNSSGRAKLELVERVNPNVLEVRDYK